MFTVEYWGSDPDEKNDDCWTGYDFASIDEARAKFAAEPDAYYYSDTAFIVLDGPGVHEQRKHPGFRPNSDRAHDAEWQREIAMEAGMLYGVDAYNDEMGY